MYNFFKIKGSWIMIGLLLAGLSCKQNSPFSKPNEKAANISVPIFNADSAYYYTAAQVAFGPRVPNTQAHKACGHYLSNELRRFGAEVTEQEMVLQTYDKQSLYAKNIIASFQPENKNRILLCAHWDSRPFADQDPNPANHRKPIDGTNDGAGACGVLLEIARLIGSQPPTMGVDIILFDAEDWGTPVFEWDRYGSAGWCLGSEYWAKNPHTEQYTAQFGILLDMVSAEGAQFYKESQSLAVAKNVVRKVWEAAQALGYDSYFVNKEGEAIEDDHVQIIRHRKIPCINIVHHNPNTGFGDYWHTLNDNMSEVSKETLKAVGQTVLHVVYNSQ
jgi:hypothetical protein